MAPRRSTFAAPRRTHDSLAAELGVDRERVRQLETSALKKLARSGRTRPVSPAALARGVGRTIWGGGCAAAIPGAPPWLGQMLSWLAGLPA